MSKQRKKVNPKFQDWENDNYTDDPALPAVKDLKPVKDILPNFSARKAYKALRAIQSIIKGGKEDISGHIDDILYGENGAWKGKK